MLEEIKEVNLSYILLAQRLIRMDKTEAMYRLGISEQVAAILDGLTLAQTVKLATTNQLLCQFRFNDHTILSALGDKGRVQSMMSTHAAIVMAGQPVAEIG